jgi:hypothetical protein
MNKNFKNKKSNLSTSVDFSNERRITGNQTTYEPFKSLEPKHVSTSGKESTYIVVYRHLGLKDFFVGTLSEIEELLSSNKIDFPTIYELKSHNPIPFKLETTTKLVFESN